MEKLQLLIAGVNSVSGCNQPPPLWEVGENDVFDGVN